jgi:hypothetical protein
MDEEAASQGVSPPSRRMCLHSLALICELHDWHSPSPTSSWYSGPVGLVKTLFVSIIGAAWPAATAALYAACVGYLGGGGRTLLN